METTDQVLDYYDAYLRGVPVEVPIVEVEATEASATPTAKTTRAKSAA